MRVVAYVLCWNEERMLPFYLRHYRQFCDKIVVYDNQSTDRSREIASSFPNVEVRELVNEGKIDERIYCKIKNEAYWEERGKADYVIVTDMDEFLWLGKDPKGKLQDLKNRGVTILMTQGFEMVSESFPDSENSAQIWLLARMGAPNKKYSKRVCFDPALDMNFTAGAHSCKPDGNVIYSDECYPILHFKYLDREYLWKKHQACSARLSENNRNNKWGWEYEESRKWLDNTFDNLQSIAFNVLKEPIYNLSNLSLLAFELVPYCDMQCQHLMCPVNDLRRYADVDTSSVISNRNIEQFYWAASNWGFKGYVGFHFYSEPLITEGRIEKIRGMINKNAKKEAKFLLWTNGNLISSVNEKRIAEGFDVVMITPHVVSRRGYYAELSKRYPNVFIVEPGQDFRMKIADAVPSQNPVRCVRPLRIEMPINVYGEVRLCCGDYRGEIKVGNILEQQYDVVIRSFLKRAYEAQGGNLSVCRKCGALPNSPLVANPSYRFENFLNDLKVKKGLKA